MVSRLTRIYISKGRPFVSEKSHSHTQQYKPAENFDEKGNEHHGSFEEWGLDSHFTLGKKDLQKLGFPKKIRVTVSVVE